MRNWTCTCGNRLNFENTLCIPCGRKVGFNPYSGNMIAIDDNVRTCRHRTGVRACNWLLNSAEPHSECLACRHNHQESMPDNALKPSHIARLEQAKRRLLCNLITLGLPIDGMAFRFLSNTPDQTESDEMVVTGHHQGVITINADEADDSVLERMRLSFGEPYRTLLGHFRHESGHFYWERLIKQTEYESQFRYLFGNANEPYQEALDNHYQKGAPQNWHKRFITAYASCHPWEDWAETWAHYLHMIDTLETAYHHHLLKILPVTQILNYSFDQLLSDWMQLTVVLNNLARSLGNRDLYPFVIYPAVAEKMGFVHYLVRQQSNLGIKNKPAQCDT